MQDIRASVTLSISTCIRQQQVDIEGSAPEAYEYSIPRMPFAATYTIPMNLQTAHGKS